MDNLITLLRLVVKQEETVKVYVPLQLEIQLETTNSTIILSQLDMKQDIFHKGQMPLRLAQAQEIPDKVIVRLESAFMLEIMILDILLLIHQ